MDEFDKLKDYINIYIQLLPYCFDTVTLNVMGNKKLTRFSKFDLPTFQEYKEREMNIPMYKESKTIVNNDLVDIHTKGLGTEDGIAYRNYNYWRGVKYYPNGMTYKINENNINKILNG